MNHNLNEILRIRLVQIFFLVFTLALIFRAGVLQLSHDPRLENLSNKQFKSNVIALPRRGSIYDRNGEALAISVKSNSLFIKPKLFLKTLPLKEQKRIIDVIAKSLGTSSESIRKKIKSNANFVWIKRKLEPTEEENLIESGIFLHNQIIGLAEESQRQYPNESLASHILGYVDIDGNGIEGLEKYYDSILSGKKIKIESHKDAKGRRIFEDENALLALQDGQSITITIDKTIQYEAEKEAKKAVSEFNAKSASIIIAQVKTGEILALANYPNFNPNYFQSYSFESKRNRAITDMIEPGSTFKPLLVTLALEKGKKPQSKIYCEKGSFIVGGRRISEAEAHEKFEWLTLSDIIKFSSNIGAAKLALELGSEPVGKFMESIGIGKKTGIDLPGEAQGIFNKKSLNSSVRLANVGFGHGFTVTPLQMLSFYLAIANNGEWIQPKLLLTNTPKETKKLFSKTSALLITKILSTVTEEKGTGVKAQIEEWPVAGKTGTAQKIDPITKKYSRSKYVASFVGFAPYQNPELVAIVVVDEPKRKYYASETAAPIFKEIMTKALLRQKVSPVNFSETVEKIALATIQEKPSKQTLEPLKPSPQLLSAFSKDESSLIRVPNFEGLTLREALKQMNENYFQVEIIGHGIVKRQEPQAGTWLNLENKKTVSVKLYLENP
jgi:cell division protein FtsI (penicillin-binding protein 3)